MSDLNSRVHYLGNIAWMQENPASHSVLLQEVAEALKMSGNQFDNSAIVTIGDQKMYLSQAIKLLQEGVITQRELRRALGLSGIKCPE